MSNDGAKTISIPVRKSGTNCPKLLTLGCILYQLQEQGPLGGCLATIG
jgi:hypothetical protein